MPATWPKRLLVAHSFGKELEEGGRISTLRSKRGRPRGCGVALFLASPTGDLYYVITTIWRGASTTVPISITHSLFTIILSLSQGIVRYTSVSSLAFISVYFPEPRGDLPFQEKTPKVRFEKTRAGDKA